MNQAEQSEYLDACQRAFLVFASRFPDYPQTEANAREMARELTASGLRPDNADHLAAVWERLRPKIAPAPQVAPESTDPVELEARELISSGRITLESINQMSGSQYELASRSAVFCKALEILEPRREPSVLTHGELVAAAGQANLSTEKGIPTTTAQKIEELEAWKRDHFARISTAGTPAAGAPRSGITNPGRDMPLPKLASEAQFAATIRQEREDQKFLEAARNKAARVRRVKANRAGG
jgi:hypothetical protein